MMPLVSLYWGKVIKHRIMQLHLTVQRNLCLINNSNNAYHYTIFSHMQVAELTREWVGKWKDIQKIIQVLAEDP